MPTDSKAQCFLLNLPGANVETCTTEDSSQMVDSTCVINHNLCLLGQFSGPSVRVSVRLIYSLEGLFSLSNIKQFTAVNGSCNIYFFNSMANKEIFGNHAIQ